MNNMPGDERNKPSDSPKGNDTRLAYTKKEDIHDPERDRERLEPDSATIDLPDVEDIPGQENITVPPPGGLGDTTIASDDE